MRHSLRRYPYGGLSPFTPDSPPEVTAGDRIWFWLTVFIIIGVIGYAS